MNSMVPIDTLLLDLDGTLVDTLPGIEFSASRALELCNAPVANADFRSRIGPPIRDILGDVSGRSEPAQLDELERAFRSVYDGGAWKTASLFPEVRETLDVLADRGLRLFVVTNKPRIPAERILAHLGVLPLLAAICTPDRRQPPCKTKAEMVGQLQAEWSLDSARMLLVGDSVDDAHAAASCGCRFAGVEFGYGTACTQSDYPVHLKLHRFGELISVLSNSLSAIH